MKFVSVTNRGTLKRKISYMYMLRNFLSISMRVTQRISFRKTSKWNNELCPFNYLIINLHAKGWSISDDGEDEMNGWRKCRVINMKLKSMSQNPSFFSNPNLFYLYIIGRWYFIWKVSKMPPILILHSWVILEIPESEWKEKKSKMFSSALKFLFKREKWETWKVINHWEIHSVQ